MTARMLIMMYCGDYGTVSTEELLPVMIQRALQENTGMFINRHAITAPTFKVSSVRLIAMRTIISMYI